MEIEELAPETTENTPAAAPAAETAPTAKEVRELQRQLAEERNRAKELEGTARYWSERAAHTPAPPAAPAKEDAPAEDLLEVITSGDSKRLAGALKRMGFVQEAEVNSRIGLARQEASTEAVLAAEYPELKDKNSPLFKEAAAQYQRLIAEEPALKNSPKTTLIAARLAAAEIRARSFEEGDDEDEDEAPVLKRKPAPARETEAERVRRVGAQGSRRSPAPARESDDELSEMQKQLVANLRAEGADITEESYKARALKGTRLRGMGR